MGIYINQHVLYSHYYGCFFIYLYFFYDNRGIFHGRALKTLHKNQNLGVLIVPTTTSTSQIQDIIIGRIQTLDHVPLTETTLPSVRPDQLGYLGGFIFSLLCASFTYFFRCESLGFDLFRQFFFSISSSLRALFASINFTPLLSTNSFEI